MPLTEVKSNKTYTDLYGDHWNNVVVFGNPDVEEKFEAHVKMEFWGEDWISICEEGVSGKPIVRTIDVQGHQESMLELDLPNVTHQWHRDAKSLTEKCAHSLKWVHILKSKPLSNKLVHKFVGEGWKQFNFNYQHSLLDEFPDEVRDPREYYTKDGVEWLKVRHPYISPKAHDSRPLYIEGSYAVYHKTKRDHRKGGKNYRIGKCLHIPRSKATDFNGEWVWVDMHIESGILTETIPQSFLDTAQYPVRINETFGYWCSGATASAVGINYAIAYGPHTSPASGSATTVHIYRTDTNNTYFTDGFWDDTGSEYPQDLQADTAGVGPTSDTGWFNTPLDAPVAVTAQTYWIGCNEYQDPSDYAYDARGGGYKRKYVAETYTWPDDHGNLVDPFPAGASNTNNRDYSAYVTYTGVSPTINQYDSLSVSDSVTVRFKYQTQSVSDSLSLSDAVEVRISPYKVAADDDISVGENTDFVISFSGNVSDSLSLADSTATRITPLKISIEDDLTVQDVLQRIYLDLLKIDQNEPIEVAEYTRAMLAALRIEETDTLSISDVIRVFETPLKLDVSDSLSVAEYINVAFAGALQKSLSDSISVSEYANLFLTPLLLDTSDSIEVTDYLRALLPLLAVSKADEISLADYVSALIPFLNRSVSDSISITDYVDATVSAVSVLTASVYEPLSISDAVAVLLTILKSSVSDVLNISDLSDVAVVGPDVTYSNYGAVFLYTVSNWQGKAFYLEVFWRSTSGTVYTRLYNITDSVEVSASTLSISGSTFTRSRSPALALTDGKEYRIQFGKAGSNAGEFLGGKLIAV